MRRVPTTEASRSWIRERVPKVAEFAAVVKEGSLQQFNIREKKHDFLDFRVQNQLEFEVVLITKLRLRSMPLGFRVGFGTM